MSENIWCPGSDGLVTVTVTSIRCTVDLGIPSRDQRESPPQQPGHRSERRLPMPASVQMRERPLVLVLVDLARFTQAIAGRTLEELVTLVDAFYRVAGTVIPDHGGRVVKFIGDGCFAVFEPDDALAALAATEEIGGRVRALGREVGVDLDVGVNVHLSTVAEV